MHERIEQAAAASSASRGRSRTASTASPSRPTACTSSIAHGVDGARRDRRRRRLRDHRRRVRGRGRGDRRRRRRRVGPRRDGAQGEGAPGRTSSATSGPTSCCSPTSTSPRTRRSPTRCSSTSTTGIAYETVQPADRRAPAARPDERGRGPHGHPGRRALPRARARRPRRAARRRSRRAARRASWCSARATSVGTGVDRAGHGGRGAPARQEPRPAALGRPDPPGPHRDPRERTAARSAGPLPTPTSSSARCSCPPGVRPIVVTEDMVRTHEAGRGDRRRRGRPGRLHRDDPRDHARRSRSTSVHGVLHYAVGNMPGAVPFTSTYASDQRDAAVRAAARDARRGRRNCGRRRRSRSG